MGRRFAEAETWIGWATVILAAGTAVWYLWRVIFWKPSTDNS
jgi:hypothetical protein